MEDIDKLIATSQTQKCLLFIDSKFRDRVVYPNPESYTISFSEPLRNVHSVKVIDSSIPRTHYNVSLVSNTLVYRMKPFDQTAWSDNWLITSIPPGNYNIDELIIVLNENLKDIEVSHLSYPSDIRKQLVFKSKHEFEIDVKTTSLKYTLGIDCMNDYGYESSIRNENNIRIRSIDNFKMYDQKVYADRNNRSDSTFSIIQDTIMYMLLQPLEEFFHVNHVTFGISDVSEYCVCVVSVVQLTPTGKIILQTKAVNVDTTTENVHVVFEDILSSIPSNEDTYISISFKNFEHGVASFSCKVYTTFPETEASKLYALKIKDNVVLSKQTINAFVTSTSLNVNISYSVMRFSIISPGMYNLVGDSYVTLRCQELDQHMGSIHSSNFLDGTGQVVKRNFDFGLGMFKLGLYGYQDEKFDDTFIDRDFFPIGKLSQLSFRFERWDGVCAEINPCMVSSNWDKNDPLNNIMIY